MAPIRLSASTAARSPESHAPPTLAHENDPSTHGSLYHRVALARWTVFLKLLPYRPSSHSSAKSTIASSPRIARSRPNFPPTSTMHSGVPETLARIPAVLVLFDFSKIKSS